MSRPVTRLLLVRHGATILSAEDRFAGSIEVPLSDEGRYQARRLGERLADVPISAVYSSPLERARETAEIVARPHRLEVQLVAAIREISHGHWERMTRHEVEKRFPAETAAWEDDPFTFAPEGGETGLAVTARALPALLELVQGHPGETLLVVSHKATIRLLLSSLLGFDPRRYRDNLDQSAAALNVVDFRGPARARLMVFNDTSHYSATPSGVPGASTSRLSPWWDHPPST